MDLKKILKFFILFVTVSQFSFAQKIEVQNAFLYWKNGELEDALKSINSATSNETTKNMAKTWMYRGNIMLSIAISEDEKDKGLVFDPVNEAYKSYQRCMELDEKKEFKYDLQIQMQILATLYYNKGAESYKKLTWHPAYKNFSRVSEIWRWLNSEFKSGIVTDTVDYTRAYCAYKSERYDESAKIFSYLIDSSKYKSSDLFNELSKVYLEKKDTVSALTTLQEGRRLYPDDDNLLIGELKIYLYTHRIDEAINNLTEAISRAPDNAQLYSALGSAYDNQNDTAKAIENFKKAISLRPDYFEPCFGVGRIYFNAAVDINKQMNTLDLKEQKKYDELQKVRDSYFQKALPYFERAKSLNPKDMDTLLALKELYVRLNQLDKVEEIKKEIEAAKH